MNRKLELAKKKKETAVKNEQLTSKEIEARSKLLEATENLYELINGQEQYDFDKLHLQLVEIDKRLDLAPYFKSLENTLKLLTPPTKNPKTKIEGFSELLKAVNSNKPIPIKIDLSSLEKSIVNIEQYIREQSKPSDQGAENYQPVRRVIKVGNRFIFDDNFTNAGGGGSGGGNTDGLTDAQLRASPVPVTASIDTTGLATSAKQDLLLTELQLKADLTETQPVSLVSVPSHAVTNAGTFAVQVTSAPTTAVTGTFWQATQPVSIASTVTTSEAAPTTILNGNKNVTTAGTRVTLASSTSCKSVTIKAKVANTGTIYVGDTSVSSSNGFALAAGETVSLDIANLNTVNLDASVSGEGVTYVGVN